MREVKLFALVFSVLILLGGVSYAQTLFGAAYIGSDGPSTLYTIDTGTGAATMVGPIGFERCAGMDFDIITQTLFAICERTDGSDEPVLVNIDPATGAGTEVGPVNSCATWQDLSFRNADNALFADGFNGCPNFNFELVNINTATGAGTTVVGITGADECCGNALDFSRADTLFYLGSDPPVANLYTLNQTTGAAALVTGINFPALLGDSPRINAMTFNPQTEILFTSIVIGGPNNPGLRQNFLGIVNIATGDLSVIGETVEGIDAIAFDPRVVVGAVPTLSEWGLIAMAGILGIVGFMVIRRRKAVT